MLRTVRLNNFIKFEDEQLLRFDTEGVFLFMGENNSGKSSVFEAIRRCLDMRSNCTFMINFPNSTENAYVVCEFTLPEAIQEEFRGNRKLLTSFVRVTNHERPNDSHFEFAKVVLITDGETGNEEVHMDIIRREDTSKCAYNLHCEIEKEQKCSLINFFKTWILTGNNGPDEFLKCVAIIIYKYLEHLQGNGENEENIKTTPTEEILKTLTQYVVFTFGYRAVGRVQWSKSENLQQREENYSEAAHRLEIIRWFEKKKEDAMYDGTNVESIFRTLTDGEMFTFQLRDKDKKKMQLLVFDSSGQIFNILKLPEGILEARHMSLLLSWKKFYTLLLEEPDRGMHLHMIHRLKSLILPKVKNKVMVFISHNGALLTPVLVPRTFRFCKFREKDVKNRQSTSEKYHIVNMGTVLNKMKNNMPRLLASEKCSNVIFAKRILFVEGDSDFNFTTALFSHILNPENEESTKSFFRLVSKVQTDLDELKALLTSLYIFKLESHGAKDKWHEFCERSKIPHMFLLDKDAVRDYEKNKKPSSNTALVTAKKIHDQVQGSIKKAEIKESEPGYIADLLRKKFLKQKNKMQNTKKTFEEAVQENIPKLKQRVEQVTDSRPMDIDTFQGITLYDTAYEINIKLWTFEYKYPARQQKNGNSIDKNINSNKRTLQVEEWNKFRACMRTMKTFSDWDKSRMLLQENDVFAWKYGSIEDAILELILEPENLDGSQQAQTASNGISDELKNTIFRRYLEFHALRINLNLESFQRKHSQNNKLYIGDDISDNDISNSINVVLRLCNENSDVVHFIRFLTEYAKQNLGCQLDKRRNSHREVRRSKKQRKKRRNTL